jgi:FkbM family methyltransferase
MSHLNRIKQVSISTGCYRPVRFLYRQFLNRTQLHELQRDTAFFSQIVERDSLCFDVGANKGEKTEALLAAGARVVAFEPQPDCVAELKARCGHRPQLTVCEAALGSEVGEATLYIHRNNQCSSLDPNWEGSSEHPIRVPVTTLDHAIAEFGAPSFCKIDVEGWELGVLKGLSRPIPLISFEYHQIEGGLEAVVKCLDCLGRLGELSINVTPAQRLEFGFPKWCSQEEFLARFPREFRERNEFFYGDIFVRMH